jgi:hypothetical protein
MRAAAGTRRHCALIAYWRALDGRAQNCLTHFVQYHTLYVESLGNTPAARQVDPR